MLKNYFVIAWRQIVKHRAYSAINVLGLVTGLTVFVFGSLLVRYEQGHDAFFAKADRVFTAGSLFAPNAGVSVAMSDNIYSAVGPLIEADIENVEAMARTIGREFLVTVGDAQFYETIRFADPSFLEIFDLRYLRGDARALSSADGVALSRATARKLFGREDVLGETLTLDHDVALRVTAVFENLPKNTHFAASLVAQSDGLTMLAPLAALDRAVEWDLAGNWNNLSTGNLTYLLYPPGTTLDDVQRDLDTIWTTHFPEPMKEFITGLRARRLVEANTVIWDMIGMPVLESVQLLALLVLVVAIVNYTNLATAQSLGRAREVGLRKTMGATRTQLLIQFLVESICIAAVSMLITLALLELLVPLFNEASDRALTLDYASTLPWILLTTLAVGVIAGAYPAFLITRVSPLQALKESGTRGAKGGAFRSLMLGVQFTISIFMLAMVIVVYAQNQQVVNGSQIYPRSQIVTLKRLGIEEIQARRDTLAEELRRVPGIEAVAFSSQVPFEQSNSTSNYTNVRGDESQDFSLQQVFIDEHFLAAYDIPLLAGRNFDATISADSVRTDVFEANVIANELALQRLGFSSPQDGIGHVYYDLPDERAPRAYTVVGVVPAQNFLGFHNEIKPIVFMMSDRATTYRVGSVRVAPGVPLGSALSEIEAQWNRLIPTYPVQTELLDETFADVFTVFELATRVLGNFAVVALLLSATGLFGLAAFMAQSRTKEIGIRKVMGAGMGQIVRLLVWQFSRPVLVSLLFALPLAYFASNIYLDFFADRIGPPAGIVAACGVVAVLFSWLIVGVHAWRVARESPIRALRYE